MWAAIRKRPEVPRQPGATPLSKSVVKNWEREKREWFTYCSDRRKWRCGAEQTNISGLSCCLRPCDVLVSAAAEGHVRVLGLCHHQRPCRCPWSQLLPEAMLMSKGHAADAGRTYLSNLCSHLRPWGHLDLSCTPGHVWVSGPTATGIVVDVHGLCYYQKAFWCGWSGLPSKVMLMSEGPAGLALPLVCSGGGMEEAQADQLSYHPGPWLGPLHHVPHLGPAGACAGAGPCETTDSWGIKERSFREGPVLTVYQKHEALNQTNNSLLWTFASWAIWAEGSIYCLAHPCQMPLWRTNMWWRSRKDGGAKRICFGFGSGFGFSKQGFSV